MRREQRELAVREHLRELRNRLTRAAIALVVTTGLSFAFYGRILEFLQRPVQQYEDTLRFKFVYIEMTEMLGVIMKTCLLAGFVLAFPFILYELVMFVSPGLTRQERRYLLTFLPATLLSFAGGALFGYYVLIPPGLKFLLSFGSDFAEPTIRIGNYINLVTMLLFWMGIVFETPLVMFLLAKLGVVSSRAMSRFRRYAALLAFLLGGIITPTFDPINQTLVAVPIIVLYELGIWLSKLAERTRRRAAKSAPESPRAA